MKSCEQAYGESERLGGGVAAVNYILRCLERRLTGMQVDGIDALSHSDARLGISLEQTVGVENPSVFREVVDAYQTKLVAGERTAGRIASGNSVDCEAASCRDRPRRAPSTSHGSRGGAFVVGWRQRETQCLAPLRLDVLAVEMHVVAQILQHAARQDAGISADSRLSRKIVQSFAHSSAQRRKAIIHYFT